VAQELARHAEPNLTAIGARLAEGVAAVRAAAAWIVPAVGAHPRAAHAVAVPYLTLWGIVTGGWQLGRGALAAQRHLSAGTGDARFLVAKIQTARFYAEALVPQAAGLAQAVAGSGDATVALAAEQF
jgi:acyl-CoA dehydrogenase